MTITEHIITIGLCVLAVQITRLVPFWIFPANRPIPEYIRYLGKVLPAAMFGMLVIYCYKNIDFCRTPWLARLYRRSISIGIAFLEKEYVSFDFRRHTVLYGAGTAGVYLIRKLVGLKAR